MEVENMEHGLVVHNYGKFVRYFVDERRWWGGLSKQLGSCHCSGRALAERSGTVVLLLGQIQRMSIPKSEHLYLSFKFKSIEL